MQEGIDSTPKTHRPVIGGCPAYYPLRRRFRAHLEFGSVRGISDEFAMHGMHNGLKTAMCSELVVNVVEMVAECLQADTQRPGDFTRILAV